LALGSCGWIAAP
jgi:hypothetical protein